MSAPRPPTPPPPPGPPPPGLGIPETYEPEWHFWVWLAGMALVIGVIVVIAVWA